MAYGQVLARFGHALSDPTRARVLLALREAPAYLMCAAQAAAVLAGLAAVAAWPGAWPADPVIALGIAAWSAWEGRQSWRGASCC